MKYLISFCGLLLSFSIFAQTLLIYDANRERHIPVTIDFPLNSASCAPDAPCPVAFLSAGNRVPYTKYQFISRSLNDEGYMTIAVNHEFPKDPPLSKKGDLFKTRIENWERGAETLNFLQQKLAKRFPAYDFQNLTLIGHSNGGDISAWLSHQDKNYISRLITLDNKRVALPKKAAISVLSIRASEYPTSSHILLTASEQKRYESCIVEIPNSKHMDLSDYGPADVKQKVSRMIAGFLTGTDCHKLQDPSQ